MSATYTCRGYNRSRDEDLAEIPDFHDPLVRAAFMGDRYRTGAKKTQVKNLIQLDEHTPISDQGGIGSCVANGWCDGMEMLMPANNTVQLSRRMMYWLCRRKEGTECRDDGTNIATAAYISAHQGVCDERLCPYDGRTVEDGGTVNDRPELEAIYSGWHHRIDASLQIKTRDAKKRIKAICETIDRKHPVVGAICLGSAFWNPPASLDAALGKPPAVTDDWHCIVFTGYAELTDGNIWLLLRNSWGEDWGSNGHVMIAADYVADPDYCSELIVPTGVPVF
jgi:hypothetical protein